MLDRKPRLNKEDLNILQVIDSSHKEWVLGGIFLDLRSNSKIFSDSVLEMPNRRQIANPLKLVKSQFLLQSSGHLLFSSITPLTNYLHLTPKRLRKRMLLWFTHSPTHFSDFEIYALNQPDVIYVHSRKAKVELSGITNSRIEIMIGAIEPKRFKEPATHGHRIAWVGTTASRKCPDRFLTIVEENPDLNFRLLGKNWAFSQYWSRVVSLQNMQYEEVDGPLSSKDFNGCDIFLSTSKLEGGPMPLMESLASGLIPLVTETGFAQDLFEICALPSNLILSNTESFHSQVTKIRSASRLNINRRTILEYDFEKLAGLIESSLNR
jgi:glycosyltransferase involved in cell wall biosynthesis